jgi:catechol 2,3-dioxygenase-like lactoylglutathione lyase family enzyme
MFDHVGMWVSDRDASRRFYELALAELGYERTHSGELYDEWEDFAIAQATSDRPPTRRLHVAFVAPSRELVDAFWRATTEAGYRDDGAPGPRPQYRPTYYGAFVLDPDGNSAEAVHAGVDRSGDNRIDHLWIRVADVAAARRFYATIAPSLGLRLAHEQADRVHFAARNRSFGLVAGEPTENLHLAFAAPDTATVDEFHRLAVAAGYRDNGAPGERPVYHAGYYGAYVLDPDGNNVEAVFHNR